MDARLFGDTSVDSVVRMDSQILPTEDRVYARGAWRPRIERWFTQEVAPFWAENGLDHVHGGFHEALTFEGQSAGKKKRVRTQARQIYAFACAKQQGWTGDAEGVIAHGLDFLVSKARTERGGFVRSLTVEGVVADPLEDAYDHSCVLLATAAAHAVGNKDALRIGQETFAFVDAHLADPIHGGFRETREGELPRRSNPHMHMFEAFIAWYQVTGDKAYLERASAIADLFRKHFFCAETWTLGEYFKEDWSRADGQKGDWSEPGHHFEWASLVTDFARLSGQSDLIGMARKLYATGVANGINRVTGLAYGATTLTGVPLDEKSRSWPQCEAVKAVLALDGADMPDLKPEIEERVARLFRWHIDTAPTGMWVDQFDADGKASAADVPASIFYHIACALAQYLDRVK